MNNKTLLILAVVAVAGVGAYIWYKKTHPTVQPNQTTGTTGNTTDASNQTTAGSLADAWDSLSNLWS